MWLLCVPNVAFMRSKIDFCVFCKYVFPVVKEFVFAVYSLGFLCEMEGMDSLSAMIWGRRAVLRVF